MITFGLYVCSRICLSTSHDDVKLLVVSMKRYADVSGVQVSPDVSDVQVSLVVAGVCVSPDLSGVDLTFTFKSCFKTIF